MNEKKYGVKNELGPYLKLAEPEVMQFDQGYLSPHFVTDQNTKNIVYENPNILIYNGKIFSMGNFIWLLEMSAHSYKPLLIIAEDLDEEVLAALIVNKLKGTLQVCAVNAPGPVEKKNNWFTAVGLMTSGKVITEVGEIRLDNAELDDLGSANKVIIEKNLTTLVIE